MQTRIITSEPIQGDKPGMTAWQRERMGPLQASPEGMSDSEQVWWLALIFLVLVPVAVGLYWSLKA